MKKDILDFFMEKESIDSDSLKVLYTFTSGENDVVWNELYTKEEHYCNSYLLADKFPGLSIGYTDTPSDLIGGSGYFTRNDMLRVGSGIVDESWTAFLDFGDKNCNIDNQIKNVPEILISSMDNPASVSGFNIGLNNANKLFIEYNDSDKKITNTLDHELANFNVISVSFSDFLNEFSLTYHDFPNGLNKNIKFAADKYLHSKVWHVGGMHDPSPQYTGYSGYADDFLFFDRSMSEITRDAFSEAFFVDEIIPSHFVTTSGYSDRMQGVNVDPSGVVGSEITGQSCLPALEVEQKVGSDILLYHIDNLTGAKYGTVVEFVSSGSGWLTQSTFVPEQLVYNTGELLTHSCKNILFADAPSNEDVYEFYLFKQPKPNLNRPTTFMGARGSNLLNTTYTKGDNINVYLNGIGQTSGIAYSIDGLHLISDGYYNTNDYVYYDRVVGETFATGFEGNTENFVINNAELTDEDIYLNGQKLISGLNYTGNNSTITLYPKLASGELSFMARAKNITSIVTGNSSEKVKTDSVDELVWLNGVKQAENMDYFRVCDCTLVDPSEKMKKQSSLIYNSEDMWQYYFGVKNNTETEFKNI